MTIMPIDRSAVERALPHVFVVIYVVAVTLGTFVGGLWAGAGIGGGIVLFLGTWAADGRVPRLDPIVSGFVLLFLASIALLSLRSLYPAVSWHLVLKETSIMVPLAVLSGPRIQARMNDPGLWRMVSMAALIGAAALGFEFLAGTPLLFAIKGNATGLTFYNRGISYLAVFAFPLLAFLWTSGRRWQAVAFVVILAVPSEMTDSRATRAAICFGLATTVLACLLPVVTHIVLTLVYLALMLMPWGVTLLFINGQTLIRRLPPSWQHRIEIWDYMSYRIFERPWLGWGIGSSRLLDYRQPHGASYVWITENAGHPHNGIIQLWVELGVPGLVLGAVFALFLLWRCASLPPRLRPFGYGAWVAALCVSLVAYNFWDDSLFSLFALTMLSFRRLAQGASPSARSPRLAPPMRSTRGVILEAAEPVPQIRRVAVDH